MTVRIINADVMDGLRQLPDESVNCVVTSPPYWGLRDYGVEGQIGLEATPEAFVARMVEVFAEIKRVLHKNGTCWVNLGDGYAAAPSGLCKVDNMRHSTLSGGKETGRRAHHDTSKIGRLGPGLKPKDLIGMPWRVAFALRAEGWWLRQDIIWHKPNPMPESIQDRCTKAHEYVFLLTKSERYFYDADAVRTPFSGETKAQSFDTMNYKSRDRYKKPDGWDTGKGGHGTIHRKGREKGQLAPADYVPPDGANRRSVWTIATEAYPDAHFATFPPELPEICIKAGCPVGGTVLDPFSGAGTTAMVADRLQRHAIGIELNPEYAAMSEKRINGDRGALLDLMEAAQ